MAVPIRSHLLDYFEAEPPAGQAQAPARAGALDPQPRRSRLLDYVEYSEHTEHLETQRSPGPKPGVPPYRTPVLVPAHPRYVDTTDVSGRPARAPFIAYELFEHPVQGRVVFAFTTPAKLVAALGEAQPWVATSIGLLAEALDEHGVTVLLDPPVAATMHPNWLSADLAAYARAVS
ncbi:SAV_915 family protein [Streptomyces sp. AC555_RSS877]|uniref:SAV_915 family protein n=1 Tax=Streptomyces sp. AC555_RSS877 TaxID=2823688 RepID=UPI0020B72840|nr:SAV_915 family protein [Streptomyces sp. AC555_RSS877]